jgi:hypothetical protein
VTVFAVRIRRNTRRCSTLGNSVVISKDNCMKRIVVTVMLVLSLFILSGGYEEENRHEDRNSQRWDQDRHSERSDRDRDSESRHEERR